MDSFLKHPVKIGTGREIFSAVGMSLFEKLEK